MIIPFIFVNRFLNQISIPKLYNSTLSHSGLVMGRWSPSARG